MDLGPAELDGDSLIRPERFIKPEVSGLAVPTIARVDGKVVVNHQVYLQWRDGHREQRPMANVLDVGGREYYVDPLPSQESTGEPPAWSRKARAKFLAGEPAPAAPTVFSQIVNQISKFVDFGCERAKGAAATVALWVMLTYFYHVFVAIPYLRLVGRPGSGKTRLLGILRRLVFRPFASSDPSGASLFRTIHHRGGTMLLDEADKLWRSNSTAGPIFSVLLAGYKQGGQLARLEFVGGVRTPISFHVFCPKATASIADLPPVLASRGIQIPMMPALPDSPVANRRVDEDPAVWQRLRDDLHALALEHGSTWLDLPNRSEVCGTIRNRHAELWQPLLSLAAWLESAGVAGLLDLVRDYALASIERTRKTAVPEEDEMLLLTLAQALLNGEQPTCKEICNRVKKAQPRLFCSLTPRGLSAQLETYGIHTNSKSGNRREFREETIEALRQVQLRFGIDLGIPNRGFWSTNFNGNGHRSDLSSRHPGGNGAESNGGEERNNSGAAGAAGAPVRRRLRTPQSLGAADMVSAASAAPAAVA